ncbi:hypothetical protein LCGC14_2714780 [marine sediment metagenome]|uniref:Uncharacterized protein n=1 Tax=marine sediment metagenome TaxID=412755 RepID=A0A0F8ZBQ7_9ZZZZ
MGRCRCSGYVVFGEHAAPKAGAETLRCRQCGHVWRDNGERCVVGLASDTLVAWCPKCGRALEG